MSDDVEARLFDSRSDVCLLSGVFGAAVLVTVVLHDAVDFTLPVQVRCGCTSSASLLPAGCWTQQDRTVPVATSILISAAARSSWRAKTMHGRDVRDAEQQRTARTTT